MNNTLIVFTSDHGEEFTEHGGMGHGTTLYNELLHVPFFIVNNSFMNIKESKIDTLVRNIDILPTVMDILNIPAITEKDGVSLLSLIEGKRETPFTNTAISRVAVRKYRVLVSILKDKFKYIRNLSANKKELYNILDDPGEQVNLLETMPEISKDKDVLQLKKELDIFVETGSTSGKEKNRIDSKTMKQLRSLGYLE